MKKDYERLRALRKYLKLSQTEFAEKLGVSRSVISNIELGIVEMKEYVIRLVSSVFNVNENWLCNGDGDMLINTPTSIIEEAIKQYNLTEIQASIIKGFLELNDANREAFTNYLLEITKEARQKIKKDEAKTDEKGIHPTISSDIANDLKKMSIIPTHTEQK